MTKQNPFPKMILEAPSYKSNEITLFPNSIHNQKYHHIHLPNLETNVIPNLNFLVWVCAHPPTPHTEHRPEAVPEWT